MDGRWRLTLPDSMVHGHIRVLVEYAAKRHVTNTLLMEYKLEAAERYGQVMELKTAISHMRLDAKRKDELIDALNMSNDALEDDIMRLEDKNKRLKPWATIAKVMVVAAGVGLAGGLAGGF